MMTTTDNFVDNTAQLQLDDSYQAAMAAVGVVLDMMGAGLDMTDLCMMTADIPDKTSTTAVGSALKPTTLAVAYGH